MARILSSLTVLFLLISLTACGQSAPTVADKFLGLLNDYQRDSLQNLLADDFQLKRTYTSYSNDKSSFIEKYLPYSRACNGKYKLLKVISGLEPKQFLVEDQSDYLKYLDVDYPTWKITLVTEDNRVKLVTIDTTETYQNYLAALKIADKLFTTWLKSNYPEETQEILFNQEGLLVKRLKEYAEKKK